VTLRTKTVLVLAATLVGLVAVLSVTASRALLDTFARSESDGVQRSMQGVLDALAVEEQAADASAARWAAGAEPSHVEPWADFVALVDAAGRVTLLGGRAVAGGDGAAVAGDLAARLGGGSALLRHSHAESARSGVLAVGSGVAVVASRPWAGPTAAGEARASVVTGRHLDDAALAHLAAVARVSLSAHPLGDAALPEDFRSAAAHEDGGGRTVVRPLAGGWIAGYRALTDVDGDPVVVLRVDAPRSLFLQGRASLGYLMASLLLAAAVFAGVSFAVLDRTVLRRLAWLAANVSQIGASRSPAARLPVHGSDELAALAVRINEMLDALARAQGERGESEARYRAVFEQGGDGIVLFDAETGAVLEANRAAQRMLGYTLGEMLDLRVQDVVVDAALVVRGHISDVRRDRVVFAGEAVLLHKDGSHVVGDVTSSLVTLHGRDAVCSVARDTGERRRLEERMRQSQRMQAVGRLAAGVAHDFNNLLQTVAATVGLLRVQGAIAEARTRSLDTLEAQVASGAALTRQLSLIARQEAPSAVPVDLDRVVAEVADFLRRVVRENVRIEVELACGELPVLGDRSRLEQMLVNLVANASEAMPEGGRVAIRTGREAATAWLEVRDHGPGIPPKVRERLFEPFFTTKEGGQHAGLGLTVVQRIVEEHGGEVTVTSQPESGSVFRVTLPLREDVRDALSPGLPAGEAGASPVGARILLVEDGDETRRGLAEMITMLGYDVTAAASAEEALREDGLAEVDLLLTDFMLPGMNGAELTREMLARRPELRVIVMSGYAAEDAVPSDDPRVRFLAKPFGMDTLAAQVRAALAAAPVTPAA